MGYARKNSINDSYTETVMIDGAMTKLIPVGDKEEGLTGYAIDLKADGLYTAFDGEFINVDGFSTIYIINTTNTVKYTVRLMWSATKGTAFYEDIPFEEFEAKGVPVTVKAPMLALQIRGDDVENAGRIANLHLYCKVL